MHLLSNSGLSFEEMLEDLNLDLGDVLHQNAHLPEVAQLQNSRKQLQICLERIKRGDEHTIVVIPSFSMKKELLENIYGIEHYELRNLWEILKAQNAQTHLIFVSSLEVHRAALEHLLSCLPQSDSILKRIQVLHLEATEETSSLSLAVRILQTPLFRQKLKDSIKTPCAYLSSFLTTEAEQKLSELLQIPFWGLHPKLQSYHTKSGNRRLFSEAKLPQVEGIGDIRTLEQLKTAIRSLWSSHQQTYQMMLKLNQGVSGNGNATLQLPISYSLFSLQSLENQNAFLLNRLETMLFQSTHMNWERFKLALSGGVVLELYIEGEKSSPSCQGIIYPNGDVAILSTHEQILDKNGQTYLGCQFPCHQDYRQEIQNLTQKIGHVMAEKGIIGAFGVDFLAVSDQQTYKIYAIEINMRQGGTTHPYQTAKQLTRANFDFPSGKLVTQSGAPVAYICYDNLIWPELIGCDLELFLQFMHVKQLIFQHSSGRGVVFHMLDALPRLGKLGFTAIAKDLAKASSLVQDLNEALKEFVLEYIQTK